MNLFQVFDYSGEGYHSVLIGKSWQVAYLNHDTIFSAPQEIERHNHTDEAFVLLEGNANLLGYNINGEISFMPMKFGKIYNVPAGVWHTIQTFPGCKCLIIENSNTHLHDVQRKTITSL